MKYVRTKDGIYEIATTYLDDWGNKSYKVINGGNREYCEIYNEILKQADTIEELCDEFVVYMIGEKQPINTPIENKTLYEQMKNVILLGMKNNLECWLKLGIWTDKGLIYVAKMNDKGELELL